MARSIVLPEKPTIEEIEVLYNQATNRFFRQNLAVIRLIKKGFSTAQITDILMISERTVHNVVAKFREGGVDVLYDGRRNNGSEPAFSKEELEEAKKNSVATPILMAAFGMQKK